MSIENNVNMIYIPFYMIKNSSDDAGKSDFRNSTINYIYIMLKYI